MTTQKNLEGYKINANILDKEYLNDVIDTTLTFLSNTLSNSLGPYGSTTIIQDRYLNHKITKDGYTILKKVFVEQEESRTIIDLVKKISRNLVRKVGDGSTSSIIVANSLYKALNSDDKLSKISPKDLLDILNAISEVLTNEITRMATPVSDDFKELKNIATVSTNNDQEMGAIIHEVFTKIGRYGFIHTEKSKHNTTYYDNTRGFEINRGVINPLMLKQDDNKVVEYEEAFVFMTDGFLVEDDIPFIVDLIGNACLKFKRPLVLIAKGYAPQIQTLIHENIMNNKELPLVAIDISTESKKSKDRFKDLAVNLGATPHLRSESEELDYEKFPLSRLGRCRRIFATETYTRFIEGEGDEKEIKARVESIENQILELNVNETYIEYDEEIYELRRRLACLQNSMATLYVGGATEDEKEATKDLVEDAVFACKSALQKGYVLGGNLIIPIIIENAGDEITKRVYEKLNNRFHFSNLEQVIALLLSKIDLAFRKSFECVLYNCFLDENEAQQYVDKCISTKSIYNLKTYKFESHEDTNIINSCETDYEILNSAISIIGLLSTSNQFVKINTIKSFSYER